MCGHYLKHDPKKRCDYYTCSKCERKHYQGDPNYRAHYKYSGRMEGKYAESVRHDLFG